MAVWSSHHRLLVGLGWLLVIVVAMGASIVMPTKTSWEQEGIGEAGDALRLYEERFGERQVPPQEVVVFSSATQVDDPAYRRTVEDLMTRLSELRTEEIRDVGGTRVSEYKRIVSGSFTHYDTGLPREASPLVAPSDSGDVSLALVSLQGDVLTAKENIDPVVRTVAQVSEESPGFTILSGGEASTFAEQDKIIEEDLGRALMLNLTVTLVILLLVFRAPVAALIPLTLAIAAVLTAFGVLSVISQSYTLSPIYTEMVLLMGLATGIDYTLFVVTRFRNERRAGRSDEEALRIAAGTSGKAVVFAGATVVLAVCGMFLVGEATFTSLGLAAVIVVMIAIIISVTLLPTLLGALAGYIDRFTLPFLVRGEERGGVWGHITDFVLARPAILAILATGLLLAAAAPIVTFNLGFNGAKALSDDVEAKRALLALEENFTLGLTSPALVVVDAGESRNVYAEDIQSGVRQLVERVQAETASAQRPDAPFGAPIQTDVNGAGDTEVIRIPLNADTGEERALDDVRRLRNELIPAAFEGSSARVSVTGATAANIDFRSHIDGRTPIVFAFVLGLAFFVLLLTFRSFVIAVKAIILNLLSVGAAYGILVLVFQEGWLLEGPLGFEATGIIESWLPLFLFAILFGLSMDYHMFILARIKEAWERGAGSDRAVSLGVRATAGTITSAAAIMIAVAMIFAFTRFLGIKQFGFGLALAIFIDATIIRSILLPATMKLLGDWNWYLPRWLEWLPHIRMAE